MLVYDPAINAGRNRSLFTTFQPWESLELLSLEPPFPRRPSTPHAPHQTTSQKHPPRFPISLPVWDLEYVAISLCVQKNMCHVLWIMVKLRKGTGLKSPGKSRCSRSGSYKEVICSSGVIQRHDTAAASPFLGVQVAWPPSSLWIT